MSKRKFRFGAAIVALSLTMVACDDTSPTDGPFGPSPGAADGALVYEQVEFLGNPLVIGYLNRVSDLLFIAARYVEQAGEQPDPIEKGS